MDESGYKGKEYIHREQEEVVQVTLGCEKEYWRRGDISRGKGKGE